ncbi:transport permease protein [Actinomycetota bacterium]|nr:transport permease protein [Actinomycetota bacterium]
MTQNTITTQLKNRPTIGQTIRQTKAMAWRTLVKIKRTPDQLVDVLIQPILFTAMFTFIFGGAISGSITDYLPIIIPGVLAQSAIMASMTTGIVLREDMEKGVFNRFKSLPIARVSALAGAAVADILRYTLIGVITMIMGFIIGLRPGGGVFGVVGSILLTTFVAWCISWIFSFLSQLVKSAQAMQGISMMILFPLTFVSNAFVPVDTLPAPLAWFANVNPVSHLVTAMRELLNNGSVGEQFWWTIICGLIVCAIFIPLAVKAYTKKG